MRLLEVLVPEDASLGAHDDQLVDGREQERTGDHALHDVAEDAAARVDPGIKLQHRGVAHGLPYKENSHIYMYVHVLTYMYIYALKKLDGYMP